MMSIDHDGIFKQLLREFFVEFLELFVPDALALIDPDKLTFLPQELFANLLDPDRRAADLVVQTPFRGQPATFIVHLEHQAQVDETLHARMFRYFARFHDHYAVPVYPIVLCSYHSPKRPAADRYGLRFPDFAVLDFRFRMVHKSVPLARLPEPCQSAGDRAAGPVQVAPRERLAVKAACIAHLVGLPISAKRRRMLRQFLEVYLLLKPDEERAFQQELPDLAPMQPEEEMTQIVGIQRQIQATEPYQALLRKVSQQGLMLLDRNWKGFFVATKAYRDIRWTQCLRRRLRYSAPIRQITTSAARTL